MGDNPLAANKPWYRYKYYKLYCHFQDSLFPETSLSHCYSCLERLRWPLVVVTKKSDKDAKQENH